MARPPDNEQRPRGGGAPSAGLDQKPELGNESNGQVNSAGNHLAAVFGDQSGWLFIGIGTDP
jgi:hypothetical protein